MAPADLASVLGDNGLAWMALRMPKSGSLHFKSTCPKCGNARPQRYELNSLLRLLNRGYPVEAYCSLCEEYWPISIKQRASLGGAAIKRGGKPTS